MPYISHLTARGNVDGVCLIMDEFQKDFNAGKKSGA